jgi:hypothetical protein
MDHRKCKNKPKIVSKDAGFSMDKWRSQHPHLHGMLVAKPRSDNHAASFLIRFDFTPFRLSGFASRGKMRERSEREIAKTNPLLSRCHIT